MVFPREAGTHLALSALSTWTDKNPGKAPTADALEKIVKEIAGSDVDLPSEVEEAIGEVYVSLIRLVHVVADKLPHSVRSPSADMPNVAAFLGGLGAQEAIKIITKQYVPIKGISVLDVITSTTGAIGA